MMIWGALIGENQTLIFQVNTFVKIADLTWRQKMARDYQPMKNNPNWIPHNQYMQTLYFIRSYKDLKEQYNDILTESAGASDGQPKGTAVGDPTSMKAQKAEKIHNDIRIIEEGIKAVPEEHRKIIWANIMDRTSFKEMGFRSERTYTLWKGVFIRYVAESKKII